MAYRKMIADYSRFLSDVTNRRGPSPIRVLTEIISKGPKSMISLAGGMPNPQLFPFASAAIKLRDGSTLNLSPEAMAQSLQYGPSPGIPALITQLTELIKHYHNPPLMSRSEQEVGFGLCMTSGAMDGLDKAFSMLVNPGDNVLVENPTYPGTLSSVRPMGCKLIPVDNDVQGLRPDKLREALAPWSPADTKDPKSGIPRVLYTVPNGANPTGFSLDTERKREILEIARQYDLIILEDDPYYFLQYGKPGPSFLALDEDGRVLRFDSFSKILSSGMRLGFVSGPKPLIQQIVYHTMASNLHASALSQTLVSEILKKWGLEGFQKHIDGVVAFYRDQKDCMIQSANKHLTGLAEWTEPMAGMFLWIKLLGIEDSQSLIAEKALAKELFLSSLLKAGVKSRMEMELEQRRQVVLAPGAIFNVDNTQKSSYVRAAFSIATPERIDEGLKRLAELIRDELAAQGKDVPT